MTTLLTASLLFVLLLLPGPAAAHDGPPYPILSDRAEGPYVISIWTDPDTTDDGTAGGQFWVLVRDRSGNAPPPGTVPTVAIAPAERAGGTTLAAAAEPVDGDTSRQFAALVMDHEGLFSVQVTVEGPLGVASVAAQVEATYDTRPPPVMLVIYLVPFVLLGILWFQVLRRRRAASAGR